MNSNKLIDYQNRMLRNNPFFPVRVEDHDKIHKFVITVTGLKQIPKLKHLILWGNGSDNEIVLLEKLLCIHASTNPSKENQREWKKHLNRYIDGLMKSNYFPDLVEDGLLMKNEKYNPKYRVIENKWERVILSKIYSLQREERGQ